METHYPEAVTSRRVQSQVPLGRLSLGYLVLGALVGVAHLAVVRASVPSNMQTLQYSAVVGVMLAGMAYAVVRRPMWVRPAWVIILVVLSLHVVGLLVRQFTQGGQRSGDLASAGAADAIFAIGYSAALAAILLMVRQVHRRAEPLWTLDGAIVFLGVWTLGAELILLPLTAQGAGLFAMGIQTFYVTLNAGLVGLGARLWLTTRPGVNRALRLGLAGVAVFALNDIVSTAGLIEGTLVGIRNGIYSGANVIAIALLAAAACDPTVVNPPARTPHEGRLSSLRSAVVVLFVAGIIATVVVHMSRAVLAWNIPLMVLCVLLVSLVAVRSVLISRAYQQVVQREEDLRAATARMTSAETRDAIDAELSASVASLLPGDEVTMSWRPTESGGVAGVVIDQLDDNGIGDVHYRYRVSDGVEDIDASLDTGMLLDPLDWAGVRALVDTSLRAQGRLRLREEREAAAEQARLSAMLAGSQDMVVLLDSRNKVTLSVGAVADLTGREADEWVGAKVGAMFSDDAIISELPGLADGQRRRVESTIRSTNRHVEATLARFSGGEVSISLHDITERLELLRQLEFRADHDILTGLPNRLFLERSMWQNDEFWHEQRRPFAMIYIDIDDFKMVNDSLGHRLGDTLLAELGRVFSDAVGQRGVLGRLGADEFAVLLPGVDLDDAMMLASELVEERLAEPVVIDGIEVLVRASAGVAASTADHAQGESLLQAANLALWDARTRGKGRIAAFRSSLRAEASRKLHDANAVTVAARERAFRFDYQPIVDVSTGRAVAMEALMRWDADGTLGGPDQFIPLAESLGELTRMLRDLIPTALRDLEAWRRIDADVKLAVNVHAAALADREFLDWLAAEVERASLPTDAVIVEVSERALVPMQADRHLTTSRDAGVPVWIDDFGTGWSNLSVLDRLPVTGVKMARELVIDNSGDVKDELVSAVLRLAHAVGFVVTAEGVETTAQLTRLRAIGVTIVQGFLVGRPMPAAAVATWLLRHGTNQAIGD